MQPSVSVCVGLCRCVCRRLPSSSLPLPPSADSDPIHRPPPLPGRRRCLSRLTQQPSPTLESDAAVCVGLCVCLCRPVIESDTAAVAAASLWTDAAVCIGLCVCLCRPVAVCHHHSHCRRLPTLIRSTDRRRCPGAANAAHRSRRRLSSLMQPSASIFVGLASSPPLPPSADSDPIH